MVKVVCIGAERLVDGRGDLGEVEYLIRRLSDEFDLQPRTLSIDPLKVDWHSELEVDHFRSGCGPIEAMDAAVELIGQGVEKAVVIEGRDYLRSEYGSAERQTAMSIYADETPLTEAYDALTNVYIENNGLSKHQFLTLRDALFENHWRCYQAQTPNAKRPNERWFEPLTELFRGVDCANPVVDFEGKLLLVSLVTAQQLGISADKIVEISAVGLGELPNDGPNYTAEIAEYRHLANAVKALELKHEGGSLRQLHVEGRLLLDLYTCYPVVPLACLMATGLVDDVNGLLEFIETNPLTQTGGMNLARGAWNNPALNGLIAMYEALVAESQLERRSGLVHGNGGLGYRQGLVLMS